MKYIAVARIYNEPDNNTAANQVWIKVVECEESELSKMESMFANDFISDGCENCDVELMPYSLFEDEWLKISEEW